MTDTSTRSPRTQRLSHSAIADACHEQVFGYRRVVWFLRRQPSPGWWAAVADYESSAPGIIRELLRSPSVVCDRTEALQALAWARAHPCWRDDEPALEALDTLAHEERQQGVGDDRTSPYARPSRNVPAPTGWPEHDGALTGGTDISTSVDTRARPQQDADLDRPIQRVRSFESGSAAVGLRPAIVAVPILAIVADFAYGRGFVNGDTMWALIEGDELAHLHRPGFEGATPHPLMTIAAAVLSPLGQAAEPAWHAIGFLSIGALLYATWLLGSALFGRPAGILAAVLVATLSIVAQLGPLAYVDFPYTALVIWAIALEARAPRRGLPVLALLAIAGLLRPEAWILAGLYWLWLLPGLDRARASQALLVVMVAPVLWALFDLAVFGDALFSFTNTVEGAASNYWSVRRPHAASDLITQAPRMLGSEARPAIVLPAAVGYLLALLYSRHGWRLVGWTAAAAVAFALPVAAGAVVNSRYMLTMLVLICVAAAGSVTGWSVAHGRPRKAWQAGAVAGLLVLVVTAPAHINHLRDLRDDVVTWRAARDRFHDVVTGPIPCRPLTFANHRPFPAVGFWTGLDPRELRDAVGGAPRTGSYLWGTLEAMTGVIYLPTDATLPPRPPSGSRVVRRQSGWTLSARCS